MVRRICYWYLFLTCCHNDEVDGRSWLSSSTRRAEILSLHQQQQRHHRRSLLSIQHPPVALIRGGGNDNYDSIQSTKSYSHNINSNFESIRARGGHSSETIPSLNDDDIDAIPTAATTIQTPDSISTSISSNKGTISVRSFSSDSIHHGGHITSQKPDKGQEDKGSKEIDTIKTTTTTTDRNVTTKTNSVGKVGHILTKEEKKEQKKKEREQRKRQKQIAKQLRNRNAMNKRRKFMHAAWGLFFATLNHFIPHKIFVPAMTIVTTGTLVLELLRYRKGFEWINDGMHKALGQALRKNEMDGRFTGSFYYFFGVTMTSALYPKSCATLGICQLAIADPTASYFGRATRHIYWSRINNGLGGLGRNKGILGFLGGALACLPLNYRILSLAKFPATTVVSSRTVFLASLALGFAGALADLIVPTPALTLPKTIYGVQVPPFHVDDNTIVPVLSGLACVQIFKLCHWPTDLPLAKYLIIQ